MRIACLGAGPAGLYFSILAKKADATRHVEVFERNRPDVTFGWGIVFSDRALASLQQADSETHAEIIRSFRHWEEIEVYFRHTMTRSGGHGFSGISRTRLLAILRQRATELGVTLSFNTTISEPEQWSGYDLVVAADGTHSPIRERYSKVFRPQIDTGRCRFIWFGTRRKLNAFTFDFRETEWGWFTLHGYRYDIEASTVVIEATEETWQRAGLDRFTAEESVAFCERLFAERLEGSPLFSNSRHRNSTEWSKFTRVHCNQWHHDNIVLIGDAAHTAHFSIGSGTRMAMEDAIVLAHCLNEQPDISHALVSYEAERKPAALRLVNAARNRMTWFENVARYAHLDPVQFSYSLLTGSQRLGHENLRQRDSAYIASVEHWIAERARIQSAQSIQTSPCPPMFTPFRIRGITLPNRVVVSSMAMYSCKDGIAADFHIAHLGECALGGAGLVMTEATYASADGRITSACTGLWNDAQQAAWSHIVAVVHRHSHARIGIQLGHAGPKGATPTPTRSVLGNDERWPLFAASAIPYDEDSQTPKEMTRADMDRVRDQLVEAVKRAVKAGFDVLEMHCAHGYLFSSFISPLTNHRTDEYGGAIENRMRYPLEVFIAMRAAWPENRPMFVRISAHDWAPGGNTDAEAVVIAAAFKVAGADLIDVSSGQTTPLAKPVYGRMYQTPFSDRIRNEIDIATMAVGNIFDHDHVNSIIAAGRADLCAIGRPHLADPHWTLRAAAAQGYGDQHWPKPYDRAKAQFESHLQVEFAGGAAK